MPQKEKACQREQARVGEEATEGDASSQAPGRIGEDSDTSQEGMDFWPQSTCRKAGDGDPERDSIEDMFGVQEESVSNRAAPGYFQMPFP